ncbi:hypothetical protein B9Z55_004349 [Caenorhabditis nigoni]|nr:hypothetical protein B9Z55_004349 [Caenorhabditis nigoni]
MCLREEALQYILEEFHSDFTSIAVPQDPLEGKEKEFIQLLIDKSNGKLRMCGSAEELLENIYIYKDFPANHKFFNIFDKPYQTRSRIFTSLNDEIYIAKSDLFVILQNMIVNFREMQGCSEWPFSEFSEFRNIPVFTISEFRNIPIFECSEFRNFGIFRFSKFRNFGIFGIFKNLNFKVKITFFSSQNAKIRRKLTKTF